MNAPFLALLCAQALFAAWGLVARSVPLPVWPLVTVMALAGYLITAARARSWAWPIPPAGWGAGLNLALDISLLVLAYRRLPLAVAITLHYLGPLLVPFLAPRTLREYGAHRKIGWALLGVGGAVLVTAPHWTALNATGVAAALASALTLAGNTLWQKRRLQTAPQPDPARAVAEYNLVLAGVAALAWGMTGTLSLPTAGWTLWALAALAGVAIQGLALLLYNAALARLPGTIVAIASTSEIAFVALFGVVIYHETLTALQVLGLALIGGVVWTLRRAEGQKPPGAREAENYGTPPPSSGDGACASFKRGKRGTPSGVK